MASCGSFSVPAMRETLPEIRCRRLLMKGEIKRVEIKCPKCGYVQTEKARPELPQD